jgi:hypothetical protein
MKTIKTIAVAITLLITSTNTFSQETEFVTPDGYKWGMTQDEVKKIKSDDPSSVTANEIKYTDLGDNCVSTFSFVDNKLVRIEEDHMLIDKKKSKAFYENTKKQFITMYGSDFGKSPGRDKKLLPRLEWYKMGTTIIIKNIMGETITIMYYKGL